MLNGLAEILKNNTISTLINFKPFKRDNIVILDDDDNVKTALISFIKYEITAIPIKGKNDEFLGIINISNLMKFIFSHETTVEIPTLLDTKLKNITANYIVEIEHVDSGMSLMHLLLNVWNKDCNPKLTHVECNHLLTSVITGIYEIITPLDFLRHLLFLNQGQASFLNDISASEIENAFDIEKGYLINWSDDARLAMERVIESDPYYLVAIVNEDTGGLEANITFSDILPADKLLLEESISIILKSHISLQAYIKTIHSKTSKLSIDPILIHSHFTIYDLIEKLTRLRIHHLWRVTADAIQKPLGAVGVLDILRYLNFVFTPFHQEIKD
jgi:CBS domain-containing protein